MCGIAVVAGRAGLLEPLTALVGSQTHRGPDARGIYVDPLGEVGLGHARLSILDLSDAGRQPMASRDGRLRIVFNGEIYNYLELRNELAQYPYASTTDTEVILAAYERWGTRCLDRLVGMFSLVIWDESQRLLFAARDRFGVKPLMYYQAGDGSLVLASEIAALFAAGVPATPDDTTWATYLTYGVSDHTPRSFWKGIQSVPPGGALIWKQGRTHEWTWYDLAEHVGVEFDRRPTDVVADEYLALLKDSIRLRFRSDVPVGINLSGGLDSSTLLGLVGAVQGAEQVKAFTFVTGHPAYDELPWVRHMLERTGHTLVPCLLSSRDVPALACSVHEHHCEPFGGIPTLAYAALFDTARSHGVKVLIDGQGMDEQWAGYDYYASETGVGPAPLVQGVRTTPVRPDCLSPDFRGCAEPFAPKRPFPDALRNLQYRDICYTKLPKALRFNDRISMRASTELREPFLDHRVMECALRQPAERKIAGSTTKWLLRRLTRELLPEAVVEAPKRALQTPQREWLATDLRYWATDRIEAALSGWGGAWLDRGAVRQAWREYCAGEPDNSFFVWQWISLGLSSARP